MKAFPDGFCKWCWGVLYYDKLSGNVLIKNALEEGIPPGQPFQLEVPCPRCRERQRIEAKKNAQNSEITQE